MGIDAFARDSFHCQTGVFHVRQGIGLWFQGQWHRIPKVSDFSQTSESQDFVTAHEL